MRERVEQAQRRELKQRAAARLARAAALAAAGAVAGRGFWQAQLPCRYDVTTLPMVDCGLFSGPGEPSAINSHGAVVGWFGNCAGTGNDSFIWNPGDPELTIIPRPAWISSFTASDINDDNIICGTGSIAGPGGGQRALAYNGKKGAWTELLPPNADEGGWSVAAALSNSGKVVGRRSLDDGGDPVDPYQACIWDFNSGLATDLGVMNGPRSFAADVSNDGVVVGWTGVGQTQTGTRAFVWDEGQLTLLDPVPGGVSSAALAVNDFGSATVYGKVFASPTAMQGALYDGSSLTALGVLPGFVDSFPNAISNDGAVFGECRIMSPAPDHEGFIWANGLIRSANEFIDPVLGLHISWLVDVNTSGQVVGRGRVGSKDVAFVLTPQPRISGDTNCDNAVDVNDLLNLVACWGPCSGCAADFNADRLVDVNDLLILVANWG